MSATFTQADLSGFYGTEQYYRHGMCRKLVYTDGIHYMNENGAGWLTDAIASHLMTNVKLRQGDLADFQIWTLKVKPDKTATLTCQADSNKPAVVRQELEYTDFPLAEIKLYVEAGGLDEHTPALVLMLPSER